MSDCTMCVLLCSHDHSDDANGRHSILHNTVIDWNDMYRRNDSKENLRWAQCDSHEHEAKGDNRVALMSANRDSERTAPTTGKAGLVNEGLFRAVLVSGNCRR